MSLQASGSQNSNQMNPSSPGTWVDSWQGRVKQRPCHQKHLHKPQWVASAAESWECSEQHCHLPPPWPCQPSQGKDCSTDLGAKLRNSELLDEELDTTVSSLQHQDLGFNLLTCSRQGQFLILRTRHHTADWKNLSRAASIQKEFSNT